MMPAATRPPMKSQPYRSMPWLTAISMRVGSGSVLPSSSKMAENLGITNTMEKINVAKPRNSTIAG